MVEDFSIQFNVLYLHTRVWAGSPWHPVYKVCSENSDTAHRKVDGIEMNIKVPYRLAIFAIIIEILIFEIVLMREALQPLEV